MEVIYSKRKNELKLVVRHGQREVEFRYTARGAWIRTIGINNAVCMELCKRFTHWMKVPVEDRKERLRRLGLLARRVQMIEALTAVMPEAPTNR